MKNNTIFNLLKITTKSNKLFLPLVLLKSILLTILTLISSFVISIILLVVTNSSGEVLKVSMIKVLILLLIILVMGILYNYVNGLVNANNRTTLENFKRLFCDKINRLKFSYLEDPSFIEIKEKAKFALEGQGVLLRTINSLSILVEKSFSIISLVSILIILEPLLIAIITVCFSIHLIILLISNKTQMKLFDNVIPINRKFGYYFDLMLDPSSAKDFRLYKIGDEAYNNFCEYTDKSAYLISNNGRKLGVFAAIDSISSVLATGLTYIIVVYRTIVNNLSIASLTFQVSAATNVLNSLNDFTNSYITLKQCSSYSKSIIELFNLEEEQNHGSVKLEEINKIEFKNVSFTYPKTTNEILHNVSFVINKNEKISIVGLNGAGKTTIIKLLCRLYDNYSGEILINDININDYDINSYRKNITCVFQDYKLFKFSIKENVCLLDDNDLMLEKVLEEIDVKKVVDKLPMSYNTPLGKDYDEAAVELSGGEMQKIAIARALYKNSSLTILDEPTSALDPKSEAAIYENFNNIVKDKTTIYVSHRMSSSIFCDKILVIENGYVKDYLPHTLLMKKPDSLYYKLFMMQANNYKE